MHALRPRMCVCLGSVPSAWAVHCFSAVPDPSSRLLPIHSQDLRVVVKKTDKQLLKDITGRIASGFHAVMVCASDSLVRQPLQP